MALSKPKAAWQFWDGQWREYSAADTGELEKGLHEGKREVLLNHYKIFLTEMLQMNMQTSFRRAVRRVVEKSEFGRYIWQYSKGDGEWVPYPYSYADTLDIAFDVYQRNGNFKQVCFHSESPFVVDLCIMKHLTQAGETFLVQATLNAKSPSNGPLAAAAAAAAAAATPTLSTTLLVSDATAGMLQPLHSLTSRKAAAGAFSSGSPAAPLSSASRPVPAGVPGGRLTGAIAAGGAGAGAGAGAEAEAGIGASPMDTSAAFMDVSTAPSASPLSPAPVAAGSDPLSRLGITCLPLAPECVQCAVCLEDFSDKCKPAVQLPQCSRHGFHLECVAGCIVNDCLKCPVCSKLYGRPMTGNQPDGHMDVQTVPHALPGFDVGTIVITYHFPPQRQGPLHPHPGMPLPGDTRRAFLPDNSAGQEVLRLLKIAWERKLIFTVGISLTYGAAAGERIVWNGIHHKTSLHGEHGFPDPTYFVRVKDELAQLGVQ